jgi:hypothetical protein
MWLSASGLPEIQGNLLKAELLELAFERASLTEPESTTPTTPTTTATVVTKVATEVGKAVDGLPRWGYTILDGDVVIFDSNFQHKTAEAALKAGQKRLSSAA